MYQRIADSTLGKVVKQAYMALEEDGALPAGTAQRMSMNSLRRGGNTISSAEGVRRAVRKKHGRWRTESMPDEYDDYGEGDEATVSRALQKSVVRELK